MFFDYIKHMQRKMEYYSLLTGKLHKKTEIKKLNNLPSNFETDLIIPILFLVQNFFLKIIFESNSKDFKNYLLATSKFGKHMQEDVNIYITQG